MPILTLPLLIAARPFVHHPMVKWVGRPAPRITSRFKTRNSWRSGKVYMGKRTVAHNGVDWCYPKVEGDDPRRWESGYTTPPDTPILAGCYGYVQGVRVWDRPTATTKGNSGGQVWINIFTGPDLGASTGWRILAHHLSAVSVTPGTYIGPETILGWIRDPAPSPSLPHNHMGLAPYDRYEPADPELLFESHEVPMLDWPRQETPAILTRDRALIAWDRAAEVARVKFAEEL